MYMCARRNSTGMYTCAGHTTLAIRVTFCTRPVLAVLLKLCTCVVMYTCDGRTSSGMYTCAGRTTSDRYVCVLDVLLKACTLVLDVLFQVHVHVCRPTLVRDVLRQVCTLVLDVGLLLQVCKTFPRGIEYFYPANASYLANVVLRLGERRRRWTNVKTTLGRCLMFDGYAYSWPTQLYIHIYIYIYIFIFHL